MTKYEARKRAEVMLAYADGKQIQVKSRIIDIWNDVVEPKFYDSHEYRVKPELVESVAYIYEHIHHADKFNIRQESGYMNDALWRELGKVTITSIDDKLIDVKIVDDE